MTVIVPQDLARIRQAFLLGLARQPLPDSLVMAAESPRDSMLTVLALTGQQQRFVPAADNLAGDIPEAARRMHADSRAIMPEAARRILFRLTALDKYEAYGLVGAMLRRANQDGFRLHPFDLPGIIATIKNSPSCLGPAEYAYLALVEGGQAPETEVTAENWTSLPPEARTAFLRDLRGREPAAARALLEGVFKSEPAAMRARLLETMQTGLSTEDLPFLESLAADRAESVRTAAAALLTRVPGAPANDARLAAAAGGFVRNKGVLARIGLSASAVAFKEPEGGSSEREKLLSQWFNGFSVSEVAAAAGLSVEEAIGAINEVHPVFDAFWARAIGDRDDATLLALAAMRLSSGTEFPRLGPLAQALASPATVDFIETLLASSFFRKAFQELAEGGTRQDPLIWTAAILPEAQYSRFLSLIDPLPPAVTRTARDVIDFFRALEAAQPR